VTLGNLKCNDGAASEGSQCDGYWLDSAGNARGVAEAKSSTDAPAEGGRQAVSEAINMAVAQVKLGVAPEDVLIPILSTSGQLMQFMALILLLPCFPMVVNLSKVLDLADDSDRLVAAGHCIKIHKFVDTPLRITNEPTDKIANVGLSCKRYHMKHIRDFFCTKGDVHASALYFLYVLGRLHKSDTCRDFVLFPFCFRQNKSNYEIVFPLLTGFRIGLPDDAEERRMFLYTGECFDCFC